MKKTFDAYYYSFEATGCVAIDRVLREVAKAGKAYHHTEWWNETDQYRPVSCRDEIQAAADLSAKELRESNDPRHG